MTVKTDICIVGAGLCGVLLASALKADGRDVLLLEARDRVGGRVLSYKGFDLGPSWIWPHNARMLALLDRLGLRAFPQHTVGRLVFEDASGAVRRDLDFATMGGALRVEGGLSRVTQALVDELGDCLRLACPVRSVAEEADDVTITTAAGVIHAKRVVIALPPRLASGLGVPVPDVPTWMAGHAKLVAIYPTPFWRAEGLNGDAISHCGPLAEIHDASPAELGMGAVFGFARVGAARQTGFQEAAIAQLVRLFGPKAKIYDEIVIKDWSIDGATATDADRTPPAAHPSYQPLASTRRLIFAGTEVAPEDGGFLEGALASAEAALLHILQTAG
jgi:monoamine oxidase